MSGWIIGIISVLFGVGILVLLFHIVSRAARRTADEWRRENMGAEVIFFVNGANCAAFPGEKVRLRGNGLLVLTPEALHFKLWAPTKSIRIPLRNIIAADIVRKFAGRWGRLPMLHIVFRTEIGETLETAWTVAGAKNWVEEIRRLKG